MFMLEENTLAVILAAGEGKRMKSRISKSCIRPAADRLLNGLQCRKRCGIDKIVVVTGNNTEQVKDCLGDKVNMLAGKAAGNGACVNGCRDTSVYERQRCGALRGRPAYYAGFAEAGHGNPQERGKCRYGTDSRCRQS